MLTTPVPDGTKIAGVRNAQDEEVQSSRLMLTSDVAVSDAAPLPVIDARLPVSLGAKAALGSLSVVQATSSPFAVTGTFWQATQPISAVALPLPAGAATSANQATQTTALATIGTRAYGTPASRLAIGASSSATSGLAATEVLLHASTRCFIRVAAAATVDAIPLEAGEKFHLRLSSGQQIHAIRDTADGFLNIVPVA